MTTTEQFGFVLAFLGLCTIGILHAAPLARGAVLCVGFLMITTGFALAGADYLLGD